MMKKLLYYFYLLCFVLMSVTLAVGIVLDNEFLGLIIFGQLIWGPISILHLLVRYVQIYGRTDLVRRHYGQSLAVTISYFAILMIAVILDNNFGFIGKDMGLPLFIFYIGVVPWTMLMYFTYIQKLDIEFQETKLALEDDLIYY